MKVCHLCVGPTRDLLNQRLYASQGTRQIFIRIVLWNRDVCLKAVAIVSDVR